MDKTDFLTSTIGNSAFLSQLFFTNLKPLSKHSQNETIIRHTIPVCENFRDESEWFQFFYTTFNNFTKINNYLG